MLAATERRLADPNLTPAEAGPVRRLQQRG
jgi:hypothetical protein